MLSKEYVLFGFAANRFNKHIQWILFIWTLEGSSVKLVNHTRTMLLHAASRDSLRNRVKNLIIRNDSFVLGEFFYSEKPGDVHWFWWMSKLSLSSQEILAPIIRKSFLDFKWAFNCYPPSWTMSQLVNSEREIISLFSNKSHLRFSVQIECGLPARKLNRMFPS